MGLKNRLSFCLVLSVVSTSVVFAQIQPTKKPAEAEEVQVPPEPEVFTNVLKCESALKDDETSDRIPENTIVLSRNQFGKYRVDRISKTLEIVDPNTSDESVLVENVSIYSCFVLATKDISIYDCPSSFNRGVILETIPGSLRGHLKVKVGPYLQMSFIDCQELRAKE